MESFDVKCGNETIKYVYNVKYLGLQIDNNLTGRACSQFGTQCANGAWFCLSGYKYNTRYHIHKSP